MKNVLILFGLLCLLSCASTKETATKQPSKPFPISQPTHYAIEQSTLVNSLVKGRQTIKLKKEAFRINFPLKIYNPELESFHALKLVISEEVLPEVNLGADSKTSLSLGPASGLASSGSYQTYYVTEGCHYIMFLPEKEERCTKIKDLAEDEILGQVEISKINYKGNTYSIEELPLSELTLTLFNDENLNDFMDDGELFVIKMEF